jgi:hypothetical protein
VLLRFSKHDGEGEGGVLLEHVLLIGVVGVEEREKSMLACTDLIGGVQKIFA